MKKVLMIIAKEGFRDEEFQVPYNRFKENNLEVTVASSSLGEARGKFGATAKVDVAIDKVEPADFDAVVFVGGPGASEYFNNPTAHRIAKEMLNSQKIVGAICIAPVTLANAGILKGKKATVWSSSEDQFGIEQLKSKGAKYRGNPLEVDGNIITANGPQAAVEFASKILEKLK